MNQNTSDLTILVVDDTPANIDVVKGVLSESYFVQAAVNGDMALKIVQKKKPDLILLDIMMPGMDGYEVCKRLKSDVTTHDIPVIFLTAKAEVEDERKGLELGAVDYITKPLSPPILKARVKTQLELRDNRIVLQEQISELEKVVRILRNKMSRTKAPKETQVLKTHEEKTEQAVVEIKNYKDYFLDDHYEDLADYEHKLDYYINQIILKEEISSELISSVAKYFKEYGRILATYPIFVRLGIGFEDFAEILLMEHLDPIEENKVMALSCLESLFFTLQQWRENVLSGSLENPNAFDNSMLSDIETIGLALQNKFDSIENDIEFF